MLDDRERKLIDKRLPPAARNRFIKISIEADAIGAANREASIRRNDLREEIRTKEDWLSRVMGEPPFPKEDEGLVIEARSSIALKRQELLDIDADPHDRKVKIQCAHTLIRRTLDFLGSVPPEMLLQASTRPAITLRQGNAPAAAVEKCRARVAELKAELSTTEAAPIPVALAKVAARQQIEQLAESGRPNAQVLIAYGEAFKWPEKVMQIVGGASGHVATVDALGLMAFLFKDQMIAVAEHECDAAADEENSLTPDARAAAVKKITALIADTEREEASLIEQAEHAGLNIGHRADIGIHALLGLSDKLVPAPAKEQTAQMEGQPRRRQHATAPVHTSSLSEPVRRDEIWQ